MAAVTQVRILVTAEYLAVFLSFSFFFWTSTYIFKEKIEVNII